MCGVAQWCPRAKHDGAKTIALRGRYQTIETIALLTPSSRPVCTLAASEPRGTNHGAAKPLRFARAGVGDGATRRGSPHRLCANHGCWVARAHEKSLTIRSTTSSRGIREGSFPLTERAATAAPNK